MTPIDKSTTTIAARIEEWEREAREGLRSRIAKDGPTELYIDQRNDRILTLCAALRSALEKTEPKNIDRIICDWTMLHQHALKEDELNGLVDTLADQLKPTLEGLE